MMRDIVLPLACYHGPRIVKADIVDIAPHITIATFAVDKRSYGYVVSNIETGCFIGSGPTRQQAIKNASERLKNKTDSDVAKALRKTKRMIASSHVYQEWF